jgi:hypothetical protein
VDERAAEVAVRCPGQKGDILDPQGLVQAQRGDRALALELVGLRIDEDVDRVADRIDADEHQQRHHDQDQHGLQAAADDVDEHDRGYSTRREKPPSAVGRTLCFH